MGKKADSLQRATGAWVSAPGVLEKLIGQFKAKERYSAVMFDKRLLITRVDEGKESRETYEFYIESVSTPQVVPFYFGKNNL